MFKRRRALHSCAGTAILIAGLAWGCKQPTPATTTKVAPATFTATQTVSAPAPALKDSAFRVAWGTVQLPARVAPGATFHVELSLTNASTASWPDRLHGDPTGSGAQAVRLSYRWLGHENGQAGYDSRVDLERPLGPSESVKLGFDITAPSQAGEYRLQFDLVQELVAWFESKGAAKLIVPLKVG